MTRPARRADRAQSNVTPFRQPPEVHLTFTAAAPAAAPVVLTIIDDEGCLEFTVPESAGRPSAAALAANPPVAVEPIEIPQPPRIGLRNPPCCGRAMVPKDSKKVGKNRSRCTCSACGKKLIVTWDDRGYPAFARRL